MADEFMQLLQELTIEQQSEIENIILALLNDHSNPKKLKVLFAV